jgi:hypothetical protein
VLDQAAIAVSILRKQDVSVAQVEFAVMFHRI